MLVKSPILNAGNFLNTLELFKRKRTKSLMKTQFVVYSMYVKLRGSRIATNIHVGCQNFLQTSLFIFLINYKFMFIKYFLIMARIMLNTVSGLQRF